MDSIVRITTAAPVKAMLQPEQSLQNILASIAQCSDLQPDIIIFPPFAFTGQCGGSFLMYNALQQQCGQTLQKLLTETASLDSYLILGTPLCCEDTVYSFCAVAYHGRVLAYIRPPQCRLDIKEIEGVAVCSWDTPFLCGNINFCVLSCSPKEFFLSQGLIAQTSCDLIIHPCFSPVMAGDMAEWKGNYRISSKNLGKAIAAVCGGAGETSSPLLYKSFCGIFECGSSLAFKESSSAPLLCTADIDSDIIKAASAPAIPSSLCEPFYCVQGLPEKASLLRRVDKTPYLPAEKHRQADYLNDLFQLQTDSLKARLQNTGIKNVVIGISGGLDSTLALLVAVQAIDALSFSRGNILAVTMPGFGTSDRTYYNALKLIKDLGCRNFDISIKAGVLQHFEDIGQDPAKKDITYENAQARERTQILFDIANRHNALVVGTGDLSESALGWCTFGGDHLAGYNVNSCILKTMVRKVVEYAAIHIFEGDISDVLLDILDTPVSPELLPPDTMGEIAQKTEDILGPYELHDFFFYYFVYYKMRPSKIFYYACIAFGDILEREFIREKLFLFIKRFFSSQFKRSCAPEAAALTPYSLSGALFSFPSDVNPQLFLDELNNTL